MNIDLAKQLAQNVHEFYEKHGAWFATTRGKVMPEQAFVSDTIRTGMTVVDVGAGNGRLAKLLPEGVTYIGVEPSETLRSYPPPYEGGVRGGCSMVDGELPYLPLADKTADVAVCLATLHHIPTKETRRASVEELVRITKHGGTILATSWLRNPKDVPVTSIEGAELGDVWMPWQGSDENDKGSRYVHFMQDDEWQELWTHPDLEIVKIGMYSKQDWTNDPSEALNWRVIAKRR